MLFRLLLLILFLPVWLNAQVSRSASIDLQSELLASFFEGTPLPSDLVLFWPQEFSEETEVDEYSLTLWFHVRQRPDMEHGNCILMFHEFDKYTLLNVDLMPGLVSVRAGRNRSFSGSTEGPLEGRWVNVTFIARKSGKQTIGELWLDGVEQPNRSESLLPLVIKESVFEVADCSLGLQISRLRLYHRALTRTEVLTLASMRPDQNQERLPAISSRLSINKDEIIALLGGSEAAAIAEEGSLESLLMLSYAAQKPKLRSLAWETDTVFRQDRPLNFGDLTLQLRRSEATCVFLMFGRQECLERGESGVEEFRVALDQMIETCKAVTPRLVIVEAAPFEKCAPPLPDLSAKNEALAKYNEVLRTLAEKHGAFFASSGEGWNHQRSYRLTSDGVNLTREGAREIGLRMLTSAGVIERPDVTTLRPLIQAKNKLWHEYWRPSNWAFLYGDRTAQPSSRDHLNPQVRWFPKELEKYQGMIREKEEAIWKQAEQLGRKVP